jgi:transposase InsO family protein
VNQLRKWKQEFERENARPNATSPPVATADVEQLRREIARLRIENEILKPRRSTSRGNRCEAAVHREPPAPLWVKVLCEVLQVSRSGYYAARCRPPSARRQRQAALSTGMQASADLVRRRFEARRANQCWLSDVTYIPTREGWLYLAAVLDLYSRAVVGWAMSRTLGTPLVIDALSMALRQRGRAPAIPRSRLHLQRGQLPADPRRPGL